MKTNKCLICRKYYKLPKFIFIPREKICFSCETKSKLLSPREHKIVEMRLGLSDRYDRTHTLEEIGKEFGVTRERIRQIEAKSIQKIIRSIFR